MKPTVYLVAYLIFSAISSIAQPGALDNSFGAGGIVLRDLGGEDVANAVLVQPDGRIIAIGNTRNGSSVDLALIRLGPNGSLDNSFGVNGIVITAIGPGIDKGYAAALQTDGKILVAGTSDAGGNFDFALARYNIDGSLDNSFSGDGLLTTDIGGDTDAAHGVVVLSNGKILLGGYTRSADDHDLAMALYNADGSLDNSFGVNGIVVSMLPGDDLCLSMALQNDGKILLGGFSETGTGYEFAVARYNSDGSPDAGFGSSGKVMTAIGSGGATGNTLAVQIDGKILLGGYYYNSNSELDLAMVRYMPNGVVDNSFSDDGIVTMPFDANEDYGPSLALQADGKVLAGGTSRSAIYRNFALARFNTDGTPDSGFGSNGMVTTEVGSYDNEASALTIQQDGKIVQVGYANGADNDLAVVRYLSVTDVGIRDHGSTINAPSVHPNPINGTISLRYELLKNEVVSIYLLDIQGKFVMTLVSEERQVAGEHRVLIDLPGSIPSGKYLIELRSSEGVVNMEVIK